jgi:septation ring formation regulator EzrA
VKKVEEEFEGKLENIKRKLRAKEEEGENHALLAIKIESLEKKNKMLLQEIETLNQEVTAKEKEAIELKRVGPSQERLKELEYQFNITIEEKEQLKATLSQKSYDIEGLEGQIKEFEGRIQELNSKSYGSNSIPLLGEIE